MKNTPPPFSSVAAFSLCLAVLGLAGCPDPVALSPFPCAEQDHFCPDPLECRGGVCVASCTTDGDCPTNNVCNGGFCAPLPDANGVCKAGLTNFAGTCGDGVTCADSRECRVGSECCGNTCTATATDSGNCGGCGMKCAPANATGVCANSQCGVLQCLTGFGDCDKKASNGCESTLATDSANCGTCGMVCAPAPNATPGCAMSACALACSPGFGDCNGVYADGCEHDVTSDSANCGMCMNACNGANATTTCTNGTCVVTSCTAPFADCDMNGDNGCEADTSSDPKNCSACGKACTGALSMCTAGACACPPANLCNGQCTDTSSDGLNCGACGHNCLGGACMNGQCQATVLAGNLNLPSWVAVSGGTVYWTERGTKGGGFLDGSVSSMPVGGGQANRFAPNQERPNGITLDNNFVYWAATGNIANNYVDGAIWRASLNGAGAMPIQTNQQAPVCVAVDQSFVYWTDEGTSADQYQDGSVWRGNVGGGGGQMLQSAQSNPFGIVVDNGLLVWVVTGTFDPNNVFRKDGHVREMPVAGGNVTSLLDGNSQELGLQISMSGSTIFCPAQGTPPNFTDGEVVSQVTADNAFATLTNGDSNPLGTATDGQSVFWTDTSSGQIRSSAIMNGKAQTIATGQVAPRTIAVDNSAVYWINTGTSANNNTDGALMRLAK